MLFRNIEDFEDDLIGKNSKMNLKGIDDHKFNIIIDQTNSSGILTAVGPDGNISFPTCESINLPTGATAEINERTGIKISCDNVHDAAGHELPYKKISCKDGDNLAPCCGTQVCNENGGCYQIQYNASLREFNCADTKPSSISGLFGCSNNGCTVATEKQNAMSQETCTQLCKKYKKCENQNLVTVYSSTNSDTFYDFDTQFPNNPCNLKDKTVQIKSKDRCYAVGGDPCGQVLPNIITENVCDLVKKPGDGCVDVDRGLNPDGSFPLKNGSNCDIDAIDNIPAGVNVTAYGYPCTNFNPGCGWLRAGPCDGQCCSGEFAKHERDMCPQHGHCGSVGTPQFFDYNDTGKLKINSCSMSFRLGPQNPNACD